MKILVTACALLFFLSCSPQHLIGKDKTDLEKYYRERPGISRLIHLSDTLISHSITSDSQHLIRFDYYFTGAGEINMEKVSTDCRSCYDSVLNLVLGQGKFRWRKINGNQFVSKFRKRLLLEKDPDGGSSYRIIRTAWTRDSYRLLFD